MSTVSLLNQPLWKPEGPVFLDRSNAGERLGRRLFTDYGKDCLKEAIIWGCPRGGLVVAKAVAEMLEAEGCHPTLGLVFCRKIPHPENSEYGIGAVTEKGSPFFLPDIVDTVKIDTESAVMVSIIKKVQEEVKRRIETYGEANEKNYSLEGRVVLIVDDGIAGGVTTIAAIMSVREFEGGDKARIIVAVPVASKRAMQRVMEVGKLNEQDICVDVVATPPAGSLWDIEHYYYPEGFPEVTDEQVIEIMRSVRSNRSD